MKTAIAALALVVVLSAGVAQAYPDHHRHQVCTWRHHHRVCHWR
ncbi:hypothetical protein [Phenylobacterium sp.]|jgi:hypothetical protein|nr:hypothetical protein [Phenylobacterium sp.]HEX3366619.1 hypothetical protein [Phenylobacterium sp.]